MKSKENSVLSRHSTLRILLLALFVSLRVWAVLDGDIVANRYSDVSRAMRLHYNSIHSSNNANTSESSDRSDGSTRTSLIRNYRNRVGHVVSTSESTSKYLDISGLNRVLQVDIDKKTILAEGNCNMETIFEAGLANGLVPKVFPELKEITVGGAIVGAGLETSSFMYGQFNDICRKIYVLLGNGTIVKCTANEESSISFESLNTTKTTTCPDSDLYHALAGSYGTLGTVLCAEIECVPAKPWVDLTIKSFRNNTAGLRYMQQRCDSYDEKRLDFIEGIQFPSEKKQILGDLAIISGRMTSGEDSGNETKVEYYYPCKSHSEWFYEKIQMVSKQLLRATSGQLDAEGSHTLRIPLKEFMFRYYRGAFWMARFLFRKLFVTSILYKLLHMADRDIVRSRMLIMDMYVPFPSTESLIEFTRRETDLTTPIWLCPIKRPGTRKQLLSPHGYAKDDSLMVDVGIYGRMRDGKARWYTRLLDLWAIKHDARKMLYSQHTYTREEFWNVNSESLLALTEGSVLARESSIANHQMNGDKVNQDWRRIAGQSTTRLDKESYCRLRDKYCAEVFPDLYDKVVASKSEITQNHLKGILGYFPSKYDNFVSDVRRKVKKDSYHTELKTEE